MSIDHQNPHVQHAICQRQMLYWMGIDMWMAKKSVNQDKQIIHFQPQPLAQPSKRLNHDLNTVPLASSSDMPEHVNQHNHHQHGLLDKNSVDNVLVQVQPHTTTNHIGIIASKRNTTKVSFALEGFGFNHQCIFIDKKQLTHEEQKLWQNIVSALNGKLHYCNFPVFENLAQAEYAQSSLQGFLFQLSQQFDHFMQIDPPTLCLSPLPEGVHVTQAVDVPLLTDMLRQSNLKQKFWQQLNALKTQQPHHKDT